MRILFTGGSSFSGYWFVTELARRGHEVVATFRKRAHEYADGRRRRRVALALEACRGVSGCEFGDRQFLDLVRHGPWDLLCHHAADVTNYKSPDFDPIAALASNARNVASVLDALKGAGRDGSLPKVVLTGSVFECDEGAGSQGLPAFSPYGLSKGLTFQVFRYYALRAGLALGKFVIPNPFGPHEDLRFTAYVMKSWFAGERAQVQTPAYVRDNIHVSLLAKAYARFAEELPARPGLFRLNPSGYPETQGAFTLRLATAMRERLGLACEFELLDQVVFSEPRVRINTDVPDAGALGWDERRAWDEYAAFYRETLAP
jgi:nucleoside-diphosphate-sugar epimerase